MSYQNLVKYIANHTTRGECQCGRCCDTRPDRDAPRHSVNVHFFWVAVQNNPTKDELLALLRAEYPQLDRLAKGPSYIEMGGALGDQGLALQLIGLGELVGLWKAITPASLGLTGEQANELAGKGFVMAGGNQELSLSTKAE